MFVEGGGLFRVHFIQSLHVSVYRYLWRCAGGDGAGRGMPSAGILLGNSEAPAAGNPRAFSQGRRRNHGAASPWVKALLLEPTSHTASHKGTRKQLGWVCLSGTSSKGNPAPPKCRCHPVLVSQLTILPVSSLQILLRCKALQDEMKMGLCAPTKQLHVI